MIRPFLVAVALLAILTSAGGTSVKRMSLDDLVKGADRILVGTVAGRTCRKNPEDRRIPIWTDVRFKDLTVLKGAVAETLTVSVGGGRLGDRKVVVAGMPELLIGGRYVVLLGKGKGPCPFIGWGQGVFRVSRPAGAVDALVSTSDGEPIREVKGGRIVLSTEKERRARVASLLLTRTEFERQISVRVRRQAAAEREARAREKKKGRKGGGR